MDCSLWVNCWHGVGGELRRLQQSLAGAWWEEAGGFARIQLEARASPKRLELHFTIRG
jgi:hypothetical protein